jgi:2-octaprenyl-6-methoxyphenol hydroxylase
MFDFDVAIAGGSIVGLALANALKNSGLKIVLVEALAPEVGLQRRRAYHITLMSGQILQGLGVWDKILSQSTTFRQIRLADEHHPAVVQLRPEDLGREALGYVAEHSVLLKALQDHLHDAEAVTWLCPAQVVGTAHDADGVTLTVAMHEQHYQVRSRLLVAADGARSPIRQQSGIKTHGWQYWQSCITAVIRPEKSHENIAREHFWGTGPFATLPLPDNRAQIVLTAPHAEAKALMEISDAAFLAELNRRYDGQLGRLELVSDRLLFPVQLMHSDRYTLPRLALVGDAAHCCHPVGGQGLNMGIQDAAALAQILQTAHQRGEDLGSLRVLKRYERWRRLENLKILGFTDFLDRTFSNHWLGLVTLRRLGLRLMQRIRPLRRFTLRLMTGLSGRVPKLAQR